MLLDRAAYRGATPTEWSAKVRKSLADRGARLLCRSFGPRTYSRLVSRVYPLVIPLPPDTEEGWKPYNLFLGSTRSLRLLSCHASVLAKNKCPHPPHRHEEEEILMLLSGRVDLVLPDIGPTAGDQRVSLRPGQFVYYPRRFAHTLQTTSGEPANYLMFLWSGYRKTTESSLSYLLSHTSDPETGDEVKNGFTSRLVFEGSTNYLRMLHCPFFVSRTRAGL